MPRPSLSCALLAGSFLLVGGGMLAAAPARPARAGGETRPVKPTKKAPEKPEAPAADAATTLAELEAGLVTSPALYLFLDPARSVLEVKSRGVVLDTIPLRHVTMLRHTPLFGTYEAPRLPLPALWQVAESPEDFSRETIAPEALRPFNPNEVEKVAGVKVTEPTEKLPPSSYRVKLDNGWELAVLDEVPRTHFFARFVQAVKNGWAHLHGESHAHPPLVAITVTPDDARRLHHLFRLKTTLLVAAGAS
ncbi:MAG: hypothetical protein ACM3OB_06450 [Acidobacteriota bacterium]